MKGLVVCEDAGTVWGNTGAQSMACVDVGVRWRSPQPARAVLSRHSSAGSLLSGTFPRFAHEGLRCSAAGYAGCLANSNFRASWRPPLSSSQRKLGSILTFLQVVGKNRKSWTPASAGVTAVRLNGDETGSGGGHPRAVWMFRTVVSAAWNPVPAPAHIVQRSMVAVLAEKQTRHHRPLSR